jgi:hypothetical protein
MLPSVPLSPLLVTLPQQSIIKDVSEWTCIPNYVGDLVGDMVGEQVGGVSERDKRVSLASISFRSHSHHLVITCDPEFQCSLYHNFVQLL